MSTEESIRRWSEAIGEVEVLEPGLTESHYDERYWDDVAAIVVEKAGERPSRSSAIEALRYALRVTFPGSAIEADNGLYRDNLNHRLDLIVDRALQTG